MAEIVTEIPWERERVAHPPEPPARQRECSIGAAADMEDLCPPGHREHREDGKPSATERLAAMGDEPHHGRKPVHPQVRSPMVGALPPSGPVSVENVLRLLEDQQHRCALTGRRLAPQDAALDHIVPVRHGGQHLIENTQVLHKDVNRAKGSLTSEQFIGMCREVVRWADTAKTHTEVQP